MIQDEYYVLESTKDSCLFSWDQKSSVIRKSPQKPVIVESPLKLRLGEPIPSHPNYADYHTAPEPLVSKIFIDAIKEHGVHGVQFIESIVRDPRNPFDNAKEYFLLHVWNRIECLDKNLSEIEYFDDGDIFSIEKMVLCDRKLESIDIEKRKIFYLSEKPSTLLIHQSIKDIIQSTNATGCRFFKASEWNSDIVFE